MPVWADLTKVAAVSLAAVFSLAGSGDAQTSDLVSQNALRVCADPANYPMSAEDGSGYENKLAEMVAAKLELPVEYVWYPQATGFIRQTLRAKRCDIVMGYAQGHELVLNTNHYFTSVYALVVPEGSELVGVDALADPLLKGRNIGIIAGTPPAAHMARNGLLTKAKPYNLVVDRRHENPVSNMLNDVQTGAIEAAIVWGPLGGPLVKTDYPGLVVTPLVKETLPPRLFFRITMGVRQGEKVWQRKLNSLIRRNQDEINALLVEAGVPLVSDLGTEVLEFSE